MSTAFSAPLIWPFPVGKLLAAPVDEEPTDEQLASNGVNTYPSDPYDSPSYTYLTSTKGPTK